MNLTKDQMVTLLGDRNKKLATMKVLGQVGKYVALCTEDYIEVYYIWDYKGTLYLVHEVDGGPSASFRFKVEG